MEGKKTNTAHETSERERAFWALSGWHVEAERELQNLVKLTKDLEPNGMLVTFTKAAETQGYSRLQIQMRVRFTYMLSSGCCV